MFHSQIAALSARSSRHHRSLRPPPRRTPARFYVVSSGRAGLACAAAAKSCSCSFYSPHKSNMLKRETKCVSIWLREEAGEGGWGLRNAALPLPPQKCRGGCQVWRRGGLGPGLPPHGLGFRVWALGFGELPAPAPPAPRDRRWAAGQRPPETGDTFRAGGRGHFSAGLSRAAVAEQGS